MTDSQAIRARASQLQKSAFHSNTDPNSSKTPTQSMPRPDFHSSSTSCSRKGNVGCNGTRGREIKMDFNLSLPKPASVKKSENKLSCHLPKYLLPDEQ